MEGRPAALQVEAGGDAVAEAQPHPQVNPNLTASLRLRYRCLRIANLDGIHGDL